MIRTTLILLLTLNIIACGQSGPDTTETASDSFASLAEKIDFLQKYVIFERTFEKLDYRISYHNNSNGFLPGPSDWDIIIVARVPATELSLWTSNAITTDQIDLTWLSSVHTEIDYSGTLDWFQGNGTVIGINKIKSVIVYRNSNMYAIN